MPVDRSFLYPRKLCLRVVYCFHVVRPSICLRVPTGQGFVFSSKSGISQGTYDFTYCSTILSNAKLCNVFYVHILSYMHVVCLFV